MSRRMYEMMRKRAQGRTTARIGIHPFDGIKYEIITLFYLPCPGIHG